jgi:arabinogalactan endo-1,4-beta-galactosidase
MTSEQRQQYEKMKQLVHFHGSLIKEKANPDNEEKYAAWVQAQIDDIDKKISDLHREITTSVEFIAFAHR